MRHATHTRVHTQAYQGSQTCCPLGHADLSLPSLSYLLGLPGQEVGVTVSHVFASSGLHEGADGAAVIGCKLVQGAKSTQWRPVGEASLLSV